ncbi:NADH dehydrogenase [Populus alba x Populus x berolinensis]|nr:NADH dehydrogenase [Populus alba x Populus x berolinensis]
MSVAAATAAGYLGRRAAQKERVRILYRRALKDTLNWAVHRHLFYEDADLLRARFETSKHVEDPDTIDRMIADGEAQYNKWRHPDPYIVPWAPGGSKFTRNPTPPEGVTIMIIYLIYYCSCGRQHGTFAVNYFSLASCVVHLHRKEFHCFVYFECIFEQLLCAFSLSNNLIVLQIEIVYNYGREDND